MPDPIDFTEVRIGFGDQVRRTDITSGWPVDSKNGAITSFAPVRSEEQSTVVDGMIVNRDADGELYRYSTDVLVTPLIFVDAAGTTLILAGVNSELTIEDAGGPVDFVAAGLKVGDTIYLDPPGATVGKQPVQILEFIDAFTIRFDNGISALKDPAGAAYTDPSTVAAFSSDYEDGTVTKAFDAWYFAFEPYKVFNGQYAQSSKKITIFATNYEFATAELNSAFDTLKANDHPLRDPIVIVAAGSTLDVTVANASLITINGVDFAAAGVRAGDVFTITAPTGQTVLPQIFTVISLSTTTITFDSDTPVSPTGLFSQGNGTDYTTALDNAFGTNALNFLGGTVEFNRVVADIVIGEGVGCHLGKISTLTGAGEQVIGFVNDIDVLNRALTILPFKYRGV